MSKEWMLSEFLDEWVNDSINKRETEKLNVWMNEKMKEWTNTCINE